MLLGLCEYHRVHQYHCAHQAPYRTAIGLAAGQSPGGAARGDQRPEALLCHRRRLGTLAVAAMPTAADSIAASSGALPDRPGAALVRHATGARRADCKYPAIAAGGVSNCGPGLGLGARAA